MIFEAHQLMLEDPDYVESIENIIRTQDVNAEYAIGATADNFAAIFEAMDDAYMQGRAADVAAVKAGRQCFLQEFSCNPCIGMIL